MATPEEIAKWMVGEVDAHGVLYQSDAASQIEDKLWG